ncbi:MAG: DUF58 domain-containing protein [Ferruginibacter sp.]
MNVYKKYIGDLFVTMRFYLAAGGCVILYVVAFFAESLLPIVNILFAVICLLAAADYFFMFLLFKAPTAKRTVSERLSNGEENTAAITISNRMPFPIQVEVIDELPIQLQERSMRFTEKIGSRGRATIRYSIKPVQRGSYAFGDIILYTASQLGLVKRRTAVSAAETVKVYPAFTQLGQYRLLAESTATEYGSRRMRKIGQSMEFEQIKDYVNGDDIRTINWKATARKGGLMVNHFADEKSQQVYCIIDKGRLMKMPFRGMSLLDYAVNATLALSNICLQKQDKIGLISFSDKPVASLRRTGKQCRKRISCRCSIKKKQTFAESDYEMLYMQVRHKIKQRSLLILFTNFESLNGLKRQVNYLRSIAKHHLLLVVFFENTELTGLAAAAAHNVEDVYIKTIADKLGYEKRLVVKELQHYGILSVLTAPEKLTVNAINKYLELKAKQAL